MTRPGKALPRFLSTQVADSRRFYFGPPPKRAEGIAVTCGGWERTASDYEINRSTFRYMALEFVAGGRGTLRIGTNENPLTRGVVFTYGPGIAHRITTDSSDRLSKYFVDLAGSSAPAAMAEAGVKPGSCHMVANPTEVQAAFDRLLEAGRRGTPTASRLAALHAQVLLLVVSDVRLPTGARGKQSWETFLRSREHIEKHCATLRTAEEAAAACRIAPAYLSRLFRRFAGQTPYRFLMRLKMNEAATLLERQGMNVSETAEAFGMDPFHFSRAFKRLHGRPPSEFMTHGGPFSSRTGRC